MPPASPSRPKTGTTASRSCPGTSKVCSWLEPHVHGEPEAPARWEGRDIDVPRHWLVSKVAHFRIQTRVRRDGEQIASADAQAAVSSAMPDALEEARRELVRQRDLAELQEAGAFDVVLRDHLEPRQPLLPHGLRASRNRRGVIRCDLTEVVEEPREVEDVAPVLPVEQEVQREFLVRDVVGERHPEVRIGVANLADNDLAHGTTGIFSRCDVRGGERVVPDDLGRRGALLDLELPN